MSTTEQTPSHAPPSPPRRRFECSVAGCGKRFTRKEHLNRHLKSHDAQFQHRCHLCGRSYARSDVLKRHIEHHPQSYAGRRTVVACAQCHERKLKCDDGIPCRSCVRFNTPCIRDAARWNNEARSVDDDSSGAHATDTDNSPLIDAMGDHGNGLGTSGMDIQDQGSWPMPEIGQPWTTATFTPDFDMMTVPNIDDMNSTWPTNPINESGETLLEQSQVNTPLSQQETSQIPTVHALSSTAQNTTSYRTSLEGHTAEQPASMDRASPSMKTFVEMYFARIHDHWPILHEPTFDIATTSHPLLASVMLLACYLEERDHHLQLYPVIFEAVLAAQLVWSTGSAQTFNANGPIKESNPSLQNLQALLLCIVYAIQCLTREGMLIKALHMNSMLISACRYRGIFDGRFAQTVEGKDLEIWLLEEQARRLAYATLRVDVYLSILVDHPPTIRYQELHIVLPKSTRLWSAATDDERRKLQWEEPAGREKAKFSSLIRDSLDPTRIEQIPRGLSESDYHLALCSLHAGSWEAAQEGHSTAIDAMAAKSSSGDSIGTFRGHLNFWRRRMEDDCHVGAKYFASGASNLKRPFSATTMMLWHITMLKMHAPLDLLRGKGAYYRYETKNGLDMRQPKAHLQHWLGSPCPRMSVWNAAQVFRVFVQEATPPTPPTQLTLNSLALPGMLMGALVTCSYAFHTSVCSACTGRPHSSPIDLIGTCDDNEDWIRWKSTGEGVVAWGLNGPLICRCQLTALVAMFRQCLSRDKYAETGFVAFIDGLRRD